MARDSAKSAESIEKLLEERLRIEQWLDRLAMTADSTPAHVRERVEADYRSRLSKVIAELHGYSGDLSAALDRQQKVRDGLAKQEADSSERLAEAELRHAVGEYDEHKWTDIKSGILESLVKIREELKTVNNEVGGLEEVMTLLRRTPQAGGQPEAIDFAAPLEPPIQAAMPPPPQPVPRSEPMAGTGAVEKKGDVLDELEFLRSVTEDEEQGPKASRATGEMQIPLESDKPAPWGTPSSLSVGAEGVSSFAETSSQPIKSTAKTLKCSECGTMNLPTEWYCERCGAELAAL